MTTAPLSVSSPQAGPVYGGMTALSARRMQREALHELEDPLGDPERFIDVTFYEQAPMTPGLSSLEVDSNYYGSTPIDQGFRKPPSLSMLVRELRTSVSVPRYRFCFEPTHLWTSLFRSPKPMERLHCAARISGSCRACISTSKPSDWHRIFIFRTVCSATMGSI